MTDQNKKPLSSKLKNSTSRLGLRALEPRILLDAAGFVTGVDVAMEVLDTQNVADDMAALFEGSVAVSPRGENLQSEDLINALNAADEEIDKSDTHTRLIDDGGKNYSLIQLSTTSDSDTNAASDDGPFEIHSGETINVDLLENDAEGSELVAIIDPANPSELISLTIDEPVELTSGLGVELLADGTFNVTGPSNPTTRFVTFDYVVQNQNGEQSQATATFDWPVAPTIDLNVVDSATTDTAVFFDPAASTPVRLANADAIGEDLDGQEIVNLTLDVSDLAVANQESILVLNSDGSTNTTFQYQPTSGAFPQGFFFNSANYTATIDSMNGVYSFARQDGAAMTTAEASALIRAIAYDNNDAVINTNRAFTFTLNDGEFDSNIATATVVFDPADLNVGAIDTDGDGVTDDIDVDDDNDGILDTVEELQSTFTALSSTLSNFNGASVFDATPTTSRSGASFSDFALGETFPGGPVMVTSPGNAGDQRSFTVEFPDGIDGVVHLAGLNIDFHTFSIFDQDGNPVNVSIVDATDDTRVSGNTISDVNPATFSNGNSASGIFRLEGSFTSLRIVREVLTPQATDGFVISFAQLLGGRDTDSDGIIDRLDIDTDNDGITDNIEAQTTVGYIAPNADDAATLASNNGLNSAYVVTNGLTPVDTDNDGDADYLDTDSDNEGGNDTVEAGLTGTATGLSTAATDADGDGLFDVFDTQNGTATDDGYDVNESLAAGALALPDSDGDASGGVPLTADVDFRDALGLDTDGDGVVDEIDIDDDNDGILDVDEGVQTLQVQGQLQFNHNENNGFGTGPTFVEFGGSPAVSDVIASAEDTVIGAGLTVLMTGQGTDNASQFEFDLDGANSNTFEEAVEAKDFIEMSFTTQDTLSSLRYLFHSFSAQDAGGSNRGDYRVTYLISDDGFETSDVLVDDFQFQPGTSGSFNGQFPPFEEYSLDRATRYSVRVYVYDAQNNPAGQITFNDQTFEFNQIVELDSDSDGIINRLDIDSDNDGITDNIEAQTTAGYIAPNSDDAATLVTNEGLNSAYVDTNGLTPVDTDGDGDTDVLDTNSDNEGGSDTVEAGLTGTATGLSRDANDVDGDGLFDVFDMQNGTAADDGFDVNESIATGAAALPDADSDASGGVPLEQDVNFRDVPNPPVLDLNSAASDADTDRGFTSEFTAGLGAVSIVDVDADALEGDHVSDFTYLTITPTSALPDGANEILQIAGVDIPLNADFAQGGVTIPGSQTQVDISYRDGVLTVREVSNGAISNAEMDALIRSVTYRNEAANLDDSIARTFDFQVAQFDPATFIIDFEELTPGTNATAEQIGSDPYWANAARQNGQIQDANNAGPFNQELADNADGTFLFHNTGGIIPNAERIIFGRDNISVEANQHYNISIDVGRQNRFSAGPFEVLINGESIGIINVNSGTIQDWQTLNFSFNSGDATEVNFQLRNTSTNSTGNDFGIDNIVFQRNPLVLSNVATATVDLVAAVAPVAQDDAFTIDENPGGAELGVITNGSVLADNGNGVDSDVNGDPLSITQINGVDVTNGEQITLDSGALLTIRTDGTFDFDPNGAFDGLDTGEIATETFTYSLSDGTSAPTDSGTVTITINGDNDAPIIDLNGPDAEGGNYAGVFVEDEAFQSLARLVSADALVQDDEDNISQVTIIPNLPVQNDGDAEFLRILTEDLNVTIRLSDGEITANTPIVFGGTTFEISTGADGSINITNAEGGTFDTDDLEGFIRLLAYGNTDQNNTAGERSFDFQVIDSSDMVVATSVLTVERSNDAPIATVSTEADGRIVAADSGETPLPTLIITPESAALTDALTEVETLTRLADGQTAAELGLISVADLLSQLDIADFEQTEFGIAVTVADESQGRFQYLRTDVEDHEWTDFQLGDPDNTDVTPVPEGEVLLLDADTIIRFVPNAGFRGGTGLEFRVWDGTVGVASNPPSTVVDDSGGVAPTNTSSLSTNIFALNLAADTDGDGVINADDVDDDNDGILDVDENSEPTLQRATLEFDSSNLPNPSLTYTDIDGSSLDATLSHDSPASVSSQSRLGPDVWTLFADGGIGGESTVLFDISANPADAVSLSIIHINGDTIRGGDEVEIFATTDQGTIITNPILTPQSGTPSYTISGNIVSANGGFGAAADDNLDVTFDASNIPNGERIVSVTVLWRDVGGASGSHGIGFQDLVISNNSEAVGTTDSDLDGIIDQLDIDSDDDGITDNIEAQTTQGYIAPSGTAAGITDINQDGFDDNYDSRSLVNGGPGLTATDSAATRAETVITPVDTDGLGMQDFRDPDSDDDGILDVNENGLGVRYVAGDTDSDGLADVFETAIDGNANDGFVVNEGVVDPQDIAGNAPYLPDSDGDATGTITPLVNDLDYRDQPDTDQDGVADHIDIDDDNDGILDDDEGVQILQVQGQLQFNHNENNGFGTGPTFVEFGGSPAVSDVIASAEDTVIGAGLTVLMTGQGTDNASQFEFDLDGANSNTFEEAVEAKDFIEMSFTTQDTLSSLRYLFHSFSAQDAGGSNRGDYRVTYLISDDGFETSDVLVDDFQFQPGTSGSFNGQFPPFEEYSLDRATRYSVRVYVYDAQNNPAGQITFNDQTFEFNQIVELDSDSDGIINRLDIDSDNDGITDNIEAQTTAGYTAPSGQGGTADFTDVDGDGLDDSYDADISAGSTEATSLGLTPVNTDAGADTPDATPDYLDTDSDNDGMNDTAEAGLGTTPATGSSTAFTDTDGDGLFNVFEDTNINDGFDVNDTNLDATDTNFNLPGVPSLDADGGNAVPLVTDLLFRDVDDVPVIVGPLVAQTGFDSMAQVPFDASVGFADPEGETLAFSSPDLPSWMSIDPMTGIITGTPPADTSQGGLAGEYVVTVVATDPAGNSVSQTVSYNFSNPAPIIDEAIFNQTEIDGATVAIVSGFIDPDGDVLSYSASGLPMGLSINPATGEITGELASDASQGGPNNDGIYTVTVTANDNEGGIATDTFAITVTNPSPDAMDDALSASEDAVVIGNVITGSDSDPDGDTLMISEVNGAAANVGMSIAGANGGLFTLDANGDISFDPNGEFETLDAGETVTTTISYTVSDGEGGTDTAVVTATITGRNDAPVVTGTLTPQSGTDGTAQLPFDASIVFSDVDGESLAFTSADLPAWMMINPATGVITGTPPAGASQGGPNMDGVYSVNVTATDPDGESVSTTVTYSFTNPIPVVDMAVGPQAAVDGEAVSITPGFVDPDGDDLTYTATGLPAGLSIDPATGEITGTLQADASQVGGGVYPITITANDGEGGIAVDTFDLTVTNPAPDAMDDGLTTTEGAVTTANILSANDVDSDGDALAVTEVNGGAANVGTAIPGSDGGLFTIDATGALSFDPNGEFQGLDIGETATTTVTYTISDGEGGTDTATVTVTVMGENDAPMLINPQDPNDPSPSIPDQTGNDSEVLPVLNLADYFTDPDMERTFFDIEGEPSWLTVDAFTGVVTASTTPANASQGGPNGDGVYPITIVASDPDGVETRVVVNYVITNPAPTAQDDVATAPEDRPVVSGNVISDDTGIGVDTDPDGDVLSVAEVNGDAALVGQPVAGTAGGDFTINLDGSYSFDPSGDFEYLAQGETVTTSVTYLVSDNEGGTDLATVTVTIEGANDAPIPVDPSQPAGPSDPTDPSDPQDPRDPPVDLENYIPAQVGDDSAPFTPFDLTPYFGDPDGTDEVTLSVDPADLPEGLVFDPTTGILSGTPSSDASQGGMDGVYTIAVTATDPSGETFTTNLEVTINNPAPVALDDFEFTDEDTVLSNSVISNINGVDRDPDGDAINVSQVNGMPIVSGAVITLPSGALLTMNDDGTYDYNPNGQFEGLAVGEAAVDSFIYQITDNQGGVSEATVTLTIEGVNDAPIPVDPSQPAGPSDPMDPSDPQDPRDPPVDPQNYIPAQTAEDGSAITPLDLTPFFGDPDGSDEVTLSVDPADLPDGLVFDPATGILSGTPSSDASQGGMNGVYTIAVTATDPSGETFTTNVTYTVTNPAPIALADNFTTPEDTPLTVNIIENSDSDPDGDNLVIDAVALPDGTIIPVGTVTEIPQGTLTVLSDGTVTLEPAPDVFGPVVFGYTLSDGQGGTDVATVTIDVTPVNDTPIPVDPTRNIAEPNNPNFPTDPEDPRDPPLDPNNYIPVQTGSDGALVTPLDLTLFFGDPDPMDVLTLSLDPAELPAGLSFDPSTGTISGTPNASASQGGDPANPGTYVIAVTATDPNGESFTTNITYMIDNPAPIAEDDGFDVSEDTDITGQLITGSDVDPDGDVLTVTQVNGDPLNVAQPIAGSEGGLFTIDANGEMSFATNGEFEDLDVGETRLTTVTYEISDGEGGFDTATVTVTVTGANDAPVVTGTLAPQMSDDSAEQLPLDVSTIFSDVDAEPLTFTSADLPSWMNIDPVTGIIVGTSPADASQGGPNADGVYVVTITATDPDGESVSSEVTYTFTNPAPTAVNDDVTTDEDTVLSGNVVTSNDTDPDGDVLTVASVNGLPANVGQSVAGSLGGEFTLNSDGSYTFDPAGDFNALGAGETLVTTLIYEISDGEGGTDTATVSVTVMGTNDGPIPVDPTRPVAPIGEPNLPVDPTDPRDPPLDPNNYIPAQTGTDSSAVTPLDLTPYFGDPDASDSVTLSIDPADLPSGLSFDPATGVLSGTLDSSASQGAPTGVFEIPVTAMDESGETFTTTLTYTVANPDPVVDAPIGAMSAADAETVSIASIFSDPDGDVLSYTATGLPAGLSIDPVTGVISGTIESSASQGGPNSDGVYSVSVTADDGEGGTVMDTFEYVISNPAPTAGDDALSASEDAAVSGNVITANDSDPDGDVLTITEVAGNPANVGLPTSGSTGGVFTISPDGSLTFDPAGDFDELALGETATSTIAYVVSDGEGGTDTAIVTVTIEGANDAPVVTGPLVDQNSADGASAEPFDASTAFTDVDGDSLTFAATGLPEGLSIDPETGLITGTLPADASQGGENSDGVYVVEVTATDPSGEMVSVFVTYTVDNPAPVAEDDVITALEGTPVSTNVIDANDSDPDGDALVIDAAALPDGTLLPIGTPIDLPEGQLTIGTTGTVDFIPTPDFNGTLVFGYTVSDGEGGTDVGTVTLNVEPVNDAPVIVDPNNPNGPTEPETVIPVQTGNDNTAVEPLDLSEFFGDPDTDDVLTVSVDPSELPEGLVFDPETGVISGTPAANASQGGDPLDPGTYVIEVTATDSSGESVTTYVTYTLANPAPIAGNDTLEVAEDTPTVLDLLANDMDPDGDALMITEINGTPVSVGVPTTLSSGGIVTLNADGTVSYEPVADYNGSDSFTYTISDGEGGTDMATVNLDVTPVNDTPTVTPELLGGPNVSGGNVSSSLSGAISVTSEDGTEVSIPTAAVFADIEDEALTYSAAGLPEGLSVDPATGLISGSIVSSASQLGPYQVTLTATDSNGESAEMTFTFNVINPAPIIGQVELPATPHVVGETVTIDVGAVTQDPDGDVLNYSADNLPPGLSVDPATGLISGTLTTPQAEPFVFIVTVTDADGATDQVELTLRVNEDGFIIPNDTADLGQDLVSTNAADPYEFLENQPIDLQRYFRERALNARDDYGRMFGDRDYRGGMVAAHVPGMGDDCAYMVVEAVANDHNLTISLGSSLSAVCDATVRNWTVSMADGASLPAWVNWSNGSDFMDVSRPADAETLGLKIRALLDNGRVSSITVDIDLQTGTVTQVGDAFAQGQTLQQQLALEALDLEERLADANRAQNALIDALSA